MLLLQPSPPVLTSWTAVPCPCFPFIFWHLRPANWRHLPSLPFATSVTHPRCFRCCSDSMPRTSFFLLGRFSLASLDAASKVSPRLIPLVLLGQMLQSSTMPSKPLPFHACHCYSPRLCQALLLGYMLAPPMPQNPPCFDLHGTRQMQASSVPSPFLLHTSFNLPRLAKHVALVS